MRIAEYKRIEEQIVTKESDCTFEHWKYGRRLVCDDKATTPNGNFRNGVLEDLIAAAAKVGVTRSRITFQRRKQCAVAYPCRSQLRHAMMQYETWYALVEAGFPPFPADEGDVPYNPLTPRERDAKAVQLLENLEKRLQYDQTLLDGMVIDGVNCDAPLLDMQQLIELEGQKRDRQIHKVEGLTLLFNTWATAVGHDLFRTPREAMKIIRDELEDIDADS